MSDDAALNEATRSAFSEHVEVNRAPDSRAAMAAMKDHVPDVVVVDLQTGSAGGYGLAKDMAMTHRLDGVSVMLLLEREQDAWLATQSGASHYLIKPIETARLAREVILMAEAGTTGTETAKKFAS